MKPPTVEELARILWRRKVWVVVPLLLGVLGGVMATRILPPRYRSTAEILIEPPKVARGLVKTITVSTVEERLAAVRKHVMARERIESLVTEFELYPELTSAGLIDQAVRETRRALFLKVGKDNSVSIQLSGGNPDRVAGAVNRLADDYIAHNSVLRDVESGGTVEFMQAQVEDSKRELEAHEAKITRFKAENLMRLPEQRESHVRLLERLQTQSETADDTISNIERRLTLLRQGIRPTEAAEPLVSPEEELLALRRQELRSLRSNFTEQHPDVIRLRQEIDVLEQEIAGGRPVQAPSAEQRVDPVVAAQIAQLEFELEDLKIEKRQLQADMLRYQSYLDQIPAAEQQLLILDREYDNLRGFYQQNLKRSTEIGQSADLEKGDLRETLRILERAAPASAPYSPNKPLVLMLGLALGGALGLGLALLRENADAAFVEPAGLRRAFPGVRVLNAIPRIQVPKADLMPAPRDSRRSA